MGIRCSPEVWDSLTNSTHDITIQLISSRWNHVEIAKATPGNVPLSPVKSYHDLFFVLGNYQLFTRVTVQISFPTAPAGVTHAEILVCSTPSDAL